MDIHELIKELNETRGRVIFLGDGVPVNEKIIREEMTVPFSFAPRAQTNRQRGASVAALGSVYFAEGKTVSAMDHAPDYLRKAQAEQGTGRGKTSGKRPMSWQQAWRWNRRCAVIRCMEERDLPAIAELEKLCFSESWSYSILEAGIPVPTMCIMYLNRKKKFLATATCGCWPGRGSAAYCRTSESRRLGLGRKMMDAMVEYAIREGAYAISLEVRERQPCGPEPV